MEKLQERHSAEVHTRALGVLWTRLLGHSQTEAMAPEVKAMREQLRTARETLEEVTMRRMAATAGLRYVDAELDDAVQSLSRHALDLARGDRKSALYKNLFHEPPAQAMRSTATPEQARYVRRLLTILQEGGPYAPLAEFIPRLTAKQEAVDTVIAQRDTLYSEEARAKMQLDMVCEDARRLYNGFVARLIIQFPEQHQLVDSFFGSL